jgi:hypothetical protein
MRFIKLFENFDNEYYLEIDNNTPINQFPFLGEISNLREKIIKLLDKIEPLLENDYC